MLKKSAWRRFTELLFLIPLPSVYNPWFFLFFIEEYVNGQNIVREIAVCHFMTKVCHKKLQKNIILAYFDTGQNGGWGTSMKTPLFVPVPVH
jgi:hypothetical protein